MARGNNNTLGQISQPFLIPPLVGGWNARDPLAAMPPTDAVALQNFVPGTGGVSLRGGSLTYVSGISGPVNSLLSYEAPDGTQKMFAASGANIYDVSVSGPVGAPVLTGMTSDIWQSVMFGTPAPASWLVACNGSDPVLEYDGSTLSVPTIFCIAVGSVAATVTISIASPAVITWANHGFSAGQGVIFTTSGALPTGLLPNTEYYVIAAGLTSGTFRVSATPGGSAINTTGTQSGTQTGQAISTVTSANFSNVATLASRLFFIEKNSLHLWYLPVGAIQGSAQIFDISQQCMLGGHLVAMATWSQDGGAGPNDYSCFFTSQGEVVIYQGTDPTQTTTWSKVGTFRIPEPIGLRCVLKSGADVAVVTTLGVVALSTVLPISISGQGRSAVTDKIKGAFQTAYQQAGSIPGWQVIEYPKGALVVVNVPQSDETTIQQYVMNTVTGAWCNFVGLNALCWTLFGQNLFFGNAAGNVIQFDVSENDDGAPINGIAFPAFSAFKTAGFKRFLMARPLYTGALGISPPVELRVDYDVSPPSGAQQIIPSPLSPWGSPWNSPWGAQTAAVSEWQCVEGIGQVGSIMIPVSSLSTLTVNHIDVLLEGGGMF